MEFSRIVWEMRYPPRRGSSSVAERQSSAYTAVKKQASETGGRVRISRALVVWRDLADDVKGHAREISDLTSASPDREIHAPMIRTRSEAMNVCKDIESRGKRPRCRWIRRAKALVFRSATAAKSGSRRKQEELVRRRSIFDKKSSAVVRVFTQL